MQRLTAFLLLHLGLAVGFECYHPIVEEVLALVDDAKVSSAKNALDLVVFLEVREDAEAGEHRIEVHEELFIGGVQLGGGAIVCEPDGEGLCVKWRPYFDGCAGRVFLRQR